MELIVSIVAGCVALLASALITILAWAFLDSRKAIHNKHIEQDRKIELLEAKLHELENEKFGKIMIILEGFTKDIEFIKNEITQIKSKENERK